jgi:hypothetical protein
MGLRNIMALQKKTRGVVRLYQGISEIVADIWRPTVKDGLSGPDTPRPSELALVRFTILPRAEDGT